MQRYLRGFRQGPAKPGSREAERGWCRHRQHLGRIDLTCQDSADAVDERVTRREHADWPAALGQDLVHGTIEWRRPRPRHAADQRGCQRQVPLAAEHDFGVADQAARHRSERINAILADADDGQPAPQYGTLRQKEINTRHASPHPRRHDGGAAAC